MIGFPGCKINLGLNITQKLPNGYHSIESIFVPLSLSDVLEIIFTPKSETSHFKYTGLVIPGDPSRNIIKKAYDLLDGKYALPSVKVHLHKIVPMGAGLGGGSADASAMLVMLNKLFNLNIPNSDIINYAAKLGADCPFFIAKKPAFISGTGEKIKPISLDLSGYKILLIYPNIHVNTAIAFQNILPKKPDENIVSVVDKHPVSEWKNFIKNDFESYVFKAYPEIAKIKSTLYKNGALYASLSGSGSAVYGIFKEDELLPFDLFKNYFTYTDLL